MQTVRKSNGHCILSLVRSCEDRFIVSRNSAYYKPPPNSNWISYAACTTCFNKQSPPCPLVSGISHSSRSTLSTSWSLWLTSIQSRQRWFLRQRVDRWRNSLQEDQQRRKRQRRWRKRGRKRGRRGRVRWSFWFACWKRWLIAVQLCRWINRRPRVSGKSSSSATHLNNHHQPTDYG